MTMIGVQRCIAICQCMVAVVVHMIVVVVNDLIEITHHRGVVMVHFGRDELPPETRREHGSENDKEDQA